MHNTKSNTKKTGDLHWSLQHKQNSPALRRVAHTLSTAKKTGMSPQLDGSSKSIFVGRANYPNIQAGILSADHAELQEDVATWIRKGYNIERIIQQRIALVHAAQKQNVHKITHELKSQDLQAVAATKRAVDAEVSLQRVSSQSFNRATEAMPFGPRVHAQRVDLTSEPRIARVVEKVMNDDDIGAAEGCSELKNKIDEQKIAQLFSAGALGNKAKRKLVPTRWSITAVDETLGLQELKKVKTLDTAAPQIFVGSYTGNYCCVVFLEGNWSYELFEMHESSPQYTTDHELFEGRKKYAEQCTGGYYAARHAVLEKCIRLNQQAQVLVFRIITNEYHTPLGVWVFKESIRNALQQKPIVVGNNNIAIDFAQAWAKRKFNYNLAPQIAASKVIKSGNQKRLSGFS